MHVEQLQLFNFRNYADVLLDLPAGRILIVGPNGAGKTNLIEAVAVAALGRSPRAAVDTEVVRHRAEGCKIALVAQGSEGPVDVKLTVSPTGSKSIIVNGRPLRRRADLLGRLPLVTFFPDDLGLVKGAPEQRRRFLDLIAAQCEPRHIADVQVYERILRQRNRLLRDIRLGHGKKILLDTFDEQFAGAGAAVVHRRLRFMVRLQHASAPLQQAIGGEGLSLSYILAGRDSHQVDRTLEISSVLAWAQQQLTLIRDDELKRGYSLWGPHRDDLSILLDGHSARFYGSQGQQRTIVLALKAGEIELLTNAHRETPLVILDDVLSELDERRVTALLQQLAGVEQVFVTATALRDEYEGPITILAVSDGTVQLVAKGGGSL